ncbi:MAG: RpiB/LacA/LacB family sugar-phosphate isomerase [Mycoplasmoidaceae bacterium]
MISYLILKKYNNLIHNKIDENDFNYFNSDEEIKNYLDLNFDENKRYIILTDDGIFLLMYLSKISYSIVAIVSDEYSAHMTIEHNNSNILIIPMNVVSCNLLLAIVNQLKKAKFEGNRHNIRIKMLNRELEENE